MRRSLLVLAAALIATGAAVAVGGRGGAAALDPVAQAATTTIAARSLSFQLVATTRSGGVATTVTGAGATDTTTHATRMTLRVPGMRTTADVLVDGQAAYLRLPPVTRMLPGGKSWLKVDLAGGGAHNGLHLSLRGLDPGAWLQRLKASGSVQTVGTETVQGVQTKHYRVVVDPQKLTGIPPELRGALGTPPTPADVWVDANGILRRLTARDATTSVALNVTPSDQRVTVTPPAASTVFDVTSLATR